MHSINQVNIYVAADKIFCPVSGSNLAPIGVGSLIFCPDVSFCFYDFAFQNFIARPSDNVFSQKIFCDLQSGFDIKFSWQFLSFDFLLFHYQSLNGFWNPILGIFI